MNKKTIICIVLVCLAIVFYVGGNSGGENVYERKDGPVPTAVRVSDTTPVPAQARSAPGTTTPEKGLYKQTEISVRGKVFNALVSDTEILRENGLSGFKGLNENEVMLFVFDNPDIIGFWMKDMLFSIDIVWLDADKKVVFIEPSVSPATYPNVFFPKTSARYVLEFTSGTVARLGIKMGDTVSIAGGK